MVPDRSVGRAEAMRQSMLALIDKGEAYEAHPAFWAPFVVVGEGAVVEFFRTTSNRRGRDGSASSIP